MVGAALVNRQFHGRSILAARATEYQLDTGVEPSQRLHYNGGTFDIELDVGERIAQALDVRDLAGQVEHVVLAADEPIHRVAIADIAEVHNHPILDRGDVEEIPAVFRDHGIDQRDVGSRCDQLNGKGRADEAEPTGDQAFLAGKRVVTIVAQ